MDCSEARLLISRGIDGELPGAPRLLLNEHLKECPDCATYMRQCRSLQNLIGKCSPVLRRAERLGEQGAAAPDGPRLAVGRGSLLHGLAALVLAAAGVAMLCLWLAERSAAGRLRAALARGISSQAAGGLLPAGPEPSSAGLDAPPSTEYVQAFHALRDYFQGDLQWVALDGPQMELGVSGYPGARQAAEQGPVAILRVRVVVEEPGSGPRVVSAPTVLLRSDARAEFRFAQADGAPARQLAYRCAYEGEPDGVVSVDLTLQGGQAGQAVHLWGAVRPDGDSRTPAAFARVGRVHYMLFLAARPLLELGRPDGQA